MHVVIIMEMCGVCAASCERDGTTMDKERLFYCRRFLEYELLNGQYIFFSLYSLDSRKFCSRWAASSLIKMRYTN